MNDCSREITGASVPSASTTIAVATGTIPPRPTTTIAVWPFCSAAVLLAILFLTINWQIVSGHRVQIWDAWAFYTPAFSLVADHAHVGRLLLLDPSLAAGTPDFAAPHVGAASPLALCIFAIGGRSGASFLPCWPLFF